ncbi:DUF2231 domain-containing protein [Chamaesiphon sp. GL140_3_metabinner_50]|uniref:DUF2231 domain-containing protein n=1 Tax=Chamaesiphon sp. GL140_3_metabinner_50 TaxID=2970812 RepID=UPI0025D20E1D|nr:DUF2231 domain-containing protein [Chamaesiphon sp. GL140_3_metabinner_50]
MAQTPSIPPFIESNTAEYLDSGIPSTVAIAKHPLHPLIVTFPIAFLSGAAGADVGYWLTGDAFWARAAIWLIGAGFVSGLVAALTGMLDFLRIDRVRKRSAGWIHMVINVTAMSLTLVNWILRLNNVEGAILPVGIVISVVVASLLAVSGWFGAELIYRHKIAVIGDSSRYEP